MPHAEQLEKVRLWVQETFHRLGAEVDEQVIETILVRKGYYCGRRFACDGLRAIWFAEERVVKLYGPDGEFLQAEPMEDVAAEPLRSAA